MKEAEKRGLSNLKTTPEALKVYTRQETAALFEKYGVLNHKEIEARYEIELEEYIKKIQIEGRILGDIATNHVLPTAVTYQNKLIENVRGLKDVFGDEYKSMSKGNIQQIKEMSEHMTNISLFVNEMTDARKKANAIENTAMRADAYCHSVKPFFDKIRYACDKLELMIDDELWPLIKYRELLFTR